MSIEYNKTPVTAEDLAEIRHAYGPEEGNLEKSGVALALWSLLDHIDTLNLDLARKTKALQRIAAWDFDIQQDCVAAAKNAARAVLSKHDGPIICDGCRVTEAWKHACQRENAQIAGERIGLPCQCEQCNPEPDEDEG